MPKIELLDQEPAKLRQYLKDHFSLSELYNVAFDSNIDYQDLNHTTHTDFARELINHTKRTGQIINLLRVALAERPDSEIDLIYQRLLQNQSSSYLATINNQTTNAPRKTNDTNVNNHINTANPQNESVASKASEYFDLGFEHTALGDYTKAFEFYNLASILYKTIGDKNGEANAFFNMGLSHYDRGNNAKALKFYNLALTLYRNIDESGEANTLMNMGAAHYRLEDNAKALEFYNLALTLYRTVDDKNGEIITLYNMGDAYYNTGQLAKAIDYLAQAVGLERQIRHSNLFRDQALLAKWQRELARKKRV
jgi:tetratricopeptide (TPR) repeat protein